MNDASLKACTLSQWEGDPRRCRWCNAKLTPRQQRWCGDDCPQAMIVNHWLSAARPAARERDGRCLRCGETVGLVVHHRDDYAKGRHHASSCCHHLDGLETLCEPCHIAEHKARPVPRRPRRAHQNKPSLARALHTPSRAPAHPPRRPELTARAVVWLEKMVAADRPLLASALGTTGSSLKHLSYQGLATNELGWWRPTAYGRARLAALHACEDDGSAAA